MPYVVIEDFKLGLDRRKSPAASTPGSLQQLSNAHINRGGEIQKRLAFVPKYQLPAGTFGFAGANGQLTVFASSALSLPAGVNLQVLTSASGSATLTGVSDAEFFNGKIFVSADFSDGTSRCFYDGAAVTDWDAGSGATTIQGKRANALLTVKNKVYAINESLLNFSSVDSPRSWGAGAGFGFINMSNESAGSEELVGLGRYLGLLAVFARRNTQIWFVDPDPLQNAQRQVIPNVGTFAPKSIVNFGDIDIIFLSDTGIRSLKARDASNSAAVNDVGTLIDDDVIAYMRTLTDSQKAAAAAIQEPSDGRYLLSIGTRAYVFSYYPSSRISAWSTYDLGFEVSDYVGMDGKVYARAGNTIYLLGGDTGDVYDAAPVVVETPYIDGRAVASWKRFNGWDAVSEGEWTVECNTDPDHPDAWSKLGILHEDVKATVTGLDLAMVGESPLVKFRLTNERAGPAKLSKLIVHYAAAPSN
jgi:hypothetical protein